MNTVRAKVPRGAFGAVKMISRGSAHSGSFPDLVFMGGRDNSPAMTRLEVVFLPERVWRFTHYNSATLRADRDGQAITRLWGVIFCCQAARLKPVPEITRRAR